MRTPLCGREAASRDRWTCRRTAGASASTDMSTIAAHAEAEQDALLHPGVHAPAGAASRRPARRRGSRPAFSAALKSCEEARSALPCMSAGLSSKSCSISACNGHPPAASRPTASSTFSIFARLARAGRHHRQPPDRLEQAHQRHRGLHRNRVRLDEVDLHQRQDIGAGWRARRRNRRAGRPARARVISPGISFEATEMMPRPPSAISGSVIASSPESTMKSSGTSWSTLAIWRCCPRLP